jgi:hypothetical protein
MAVGLLVLLIQAGDTRRESLRRAGGAVAPGPARPEPAPTKEGERASPLGPPAPVTPPPVATRKPPTVAPRPLAAPRPQVVIGPPRSQPTAPAPGAPTAPASPSSPASEPPQAGTPPTPPPTSQPGKPSASILDLAGLEQRLRDTKAIGVFTKLSLKNQVDDLLDEFRDFHRSQDRSLLIKLREAFDLLVLKVLSLLQDGDPALARDVASSREALWNILTDPDTFKNL